MTSSEDQWGSRVSIEIINPNLIASAFSTYDALYYRLWALDFYSMNVDNGEAELSCIEIKGIIFKELVFV